MFDRLVGLFAKAVATGASPAAVPGGGDATSTGGLGAGSAAAAAAAVADGAAVGAGPVDAAELSAAMLVHRSKAWEHACRALAAAQLVDIATFDTVQRATDKADHVGARLTGRTVNHEVAINLGISATAAASKVAFARAVVDDHEALLRVLADGLISEWQLRAVVAATEDLTPEQKAIVAGQLAVLIRARHARGVIELTAYKLAQAATRLVIAIDPDAATRRYERARRAREVSVTARRDGASALWVKGPAEQTQHMYDTVERDARTRRHDGDDRDLQTLMFEQIYETLIGVKPWTGPDPIPQPDPTDEPDPHHDQPDVEDEDGAPEHEHEDCDHDQHDEDEDEAASDGDSRAEAKADAKARAKGSAGGRDSDHEAQSAPGPEGANAKPSNSHHGGGDHGDDAAAARATAGAHTAADDASEATGTAEATGAPGERAAVRRRWRQRVRYLSPGDLDPDDPVHDGYCHHHPDDTGGLAGRRRRSLSAPVLTRRDQHLEIQILMSAPTLLGLDEQPALLRGYGAIPAEIARRIADTTTTNDPGTLNLRRLFCDPDDGRLLTMDTHTRRFTGPLRAYAIYRDQDCRISGARIRDIDHITAHRHHGPTSAHNGQSLARNAHVLRDHPHVHVTTRAPDPRPGERPGMQRGDGSVDPPTDPPASPPAEQPDEQPGEHPAAPSDGPHSEHPVPTPDPPVDATSQRPLAPPDPVAERPTPEELLRNLRHNAPNIDWTMPTGRTYTSEPPPALGHGHTARPFSSLLDVRLEDLTHRARDPD